MRKVSFHKWRLTIWAYLFVVLAVCLPFAVKSANVGGMCAANTITAHAAGGDLVEIKNYDVSMSVGRDRKVAVEERITVTFLANHLTMFYRSLPTTGTRYQNVVAACPNNKDFSYHVADNPDTGGFIDVNCVGGAQKGNTWTYKISYIMEQATGVMKDAMIMDVVGLGWTVPLHNVTVTVSFPSSPSSYEVYTDVFGAENENRVVQTWLDEKTLCLSADVLNRVYSEKYEEYVTGGITLKFEMPTGVIENYTHTRLFTADIWKIVLGAVFAVALAILLLLFTRNKREVITIVNVKAPDGMDPMKMGKWLDGVVDSEDITSMVYYFANEGYLKIDMTNKDDPVLIRQKTSLPDDAPAHQKTLFKGLFDGNGDEIRVSELSEKFYSSAEKAKMQVQNPPTMYEKKSLFGYFSGGVIGILLGFLTPFLMSKRIGGEYVYALGVVFVIPIVVIWLLGYVAENYRYKWKAKKRFAFQTIQVGVALLFSVLYVLLFANFVMTGYEKALLCVGVFACVFITQRAISRSEKYGLILSEILGFKEFIVVTEEDKIRFMLEQNPELYYKVLPYAQVLGVTDEWTDKFKNILLAPPSWYTCSTEWTVLDYWIMHQAFRSSMRNAYLRGAAASVKRNGGGHIGRSGGGGSFGGFGGGGFGGGGGGAR